MRKVITFALVLVTASVGGAGVFAQALPSAPLASIAGQAVDAGGRAVVLQRVDLVRDGEIAQSVNTDIRGAWSFSSVAEGEYVVRMTMNEQVAGIRVSVEQGQTVANQLIVTPAAAAPAAVFLAALGLLGGALAGAAVAIAIITTAFVVTGS